MNRRNFLNTLAATSPLLLGGCSLLQHCRSCLPFLPSTTPPIDNTQPEDLGEVQAKPADDSLPENSKLTGTHQDRSDHFDRTFIEDIFLPENKLSTLKMITYKLRATQSYVGHGNFNLLDMDQFMRVVQQLPGQLSLTPSEKTFLEEIFYFDAKKYGFNGDKVFTQFSIPHNTVDVLKIPATGHYLRKENSLETYQKLKKDVGNSLVLTSGFRGMAKQFHLFFEKTIESEGNLSKASRSLAPPGYSFHGRGDFDVGKVGYGLKNFTQDFSTTDEFKKLTDLGYVDIRYTKSNQLGVRFEPWHIKIDV